jgi:hypothetical protein
MALCAATSAGGADGGPAPAGAPALVDMSVLAVPIVDGDRIQGELHVRLVLNAGDDSAAERVTAAMPRLRSASLLTLLEFARLYASPFRAVDSERLSRSLTEALHKAEPGVAEVLIVEVGAKPI